MDRIELELAAYSDPEGKLPSFFTKNAAIWVPPDADVCSRFVLPMAELPGKFRKSAPGPPWLPWPRGPGDRRSAGPLNPWIDPLLMRARQCIIYPWPKDCPKNRGLLPYDLRKAGWRRVKDTATVLWDFIKLTDASPEKIKGFVLKWGPLWRCSKHPGHFYGDGHYKDCLWLPFEPLDLFRSLANEAQAAIAIAMKLKAKKNASFERWKQLGFGRYNFDWKLEEQKFLLTQVINGYIGGISLITEWNNQQPELIIGTGLGFIKVVWLSIAQIITGSKGFFTCNDCGNLYPREGRRPKEGEKNFCRACRQGGKASKRSYEKFKRVRPPQQRDSKKES